MYGRTCVGADPYGRGGPSFGMMLLGGVAVGVAVLWVKHQSDQIRTLSTTAGVPYEGFIRSLGTRTRDLSGSARDKFQAFSQRFGARKEI